MGQRNTLNSGHMIAFEPDQPDPCAFYGNVPAFPQPNIHNTYLHPLPEQHDNAVFYGMTHFNGAIHQCPATNLDLAMATPSNHYNPYVAPPSVIHGAHDHLPFANTPGMVGIHPNGYGRNIPYADGARMLFKRKSAEGIPMNFQYHPAMAGSSSSVAPVITRVHEAEGSFVDVASHTPDVGQAFPLPPNPWLDMQHNSNQTAPLPFVHANNGSVTSFMPPPIPQGFSSVHHLPPAMQAMRGHNINFPPQVAAPSRRLVTNGSSSSGLIPFPGVLEAGPRYMGPSPPSAFRIYRPQRRDLMVEPNVMRSRNIPNMRVLPEDGVAILEFQDYNEVVDSVDQHRDMRMDIDHMSYEELLALGEQIGCVTTGLSEKDIMGLLKTRSFTCSETSNPHTSESSDQGTEFCVVCQGDYKDQETIGIVECGHEYHIDCIKKWLLVKNSCPICKSPALSKGKTNP